MTNFDAYVYLRSKRVTFTRDDSSFSTVVEELNNFRMYNPVEFRSALFNAALPVEGLDQFSSVLKVDVLVQWALADVLLLPISVVIFGKSQQRQQPLQCHVSWQLLLLLQPHSLY